MRCSRGVERADNEKACVSQDFRDGSENWAGSEPMERHMREIMNENES